MKLSLFSRLKATHAGHHGAVLLALILTASGGTIRAVEKPNIIVIMADDLGYGELGCYGQQHVQTPQLDKMAAEGMRFTDFYAGSTVCAPSRCVLMTGLHTGHSYFRDNKSLALPDVQVTVAEVLQKQGYSTALIGKWGLGEEGTSGHPNRQGFDYFFGYLNQAHAHNYYPEFLFRGEKRVALRNVVKPRHSGRSPGSGVAIKKIDYSHDLFVEDALNWLETNFEKPFFLYLPLTIPHANNEARRAIEDGTEVPDFGIYENKGWTSQNKGHAAMISRMDRDVGRLLERLKELRVDDRTLVIFTSDNGHHTESGHDPEFFDSNGPLRGKKRDLYDGGIRVPAIAWWPGTIKAGTTTNHISYSGDFMATAAELARAKLPSDCDSISFLPTLIGRPQNQQKHEYLYWEFHSHGFSQALRLGKWKVVRNRSQDSPIKLYDLTDDVGETRDMAASHPDLVERARSLLSTARTDSKHFLIKE